MLGDERLKVTETAEMDDEGWGREGKMMVRTDRTLFQWPPGSRVHQGRERVRLPSGFGLGDS